MSSAAPAYLLHDLAVSPDGKYVLAVATGDDGYSRMWSFDVERRRFSSLSHAPRRLPVRMECRWRRAVLRGQRVPR